MINNLSAFWTRTSKPALALLGAVGRASCANFQGSIAPHISLEQIVDNVQCELQAAYKDFGPHYKWLDHWAASFTITMKREDRAGVSPKFDFLEADKFGLGATGEVSSDTIRSITSKRTLLLEDLKNYTCKRPPPGLLTGRLGLYENLNETLHSRGPDDVAGEEPDDLGYRIDFSVKLAAGVTPTWILTRIPGLGATFAGSLESTHILDIAFTDATPRASKVCVVNLHPGAPYLDCSIAPAPPRGAAPPRARVRQKADRTNATSTARGRVTPDVRQRLDNTLQRLQLENLLPQRLR